MKRRELSATVIGLCALMISVAAAQPQYSLRFFGNGTDDIDRVKIQIDDPNNNLPGPPADVGATDFTIEFWVRGYLSENTSPSVVCGANEDWIYGNIVFDRDRFSQGRKFGISIANGRVVFGVTNASFEARTICGTTNVLDGEWHHIAVQRRRSDGWMWLYVDGQLQAQADGPNGDISYPDNGVPCSNCCNGNPCNFSDPFIVLGAEKHDFDPSNYPSFSGWMDELRLSTVLRYSGNFTPPSSPFVPDTNTAALYHMDELSGNDVLDSSNAPGGPSHGVLRFGGNPAGPLRSVQSPFRRSGDVDGNGCVDDADLLQVLFAFGASATDHPADVNNDEIVDDADLLIVLFNFGSGC
ncbi:MAG: LamG-like jellyroll fold domain-containing protein [Fimbriimonadales bacterium]